MRLLFISMLKYSILPVITAAIAVCSGAGVARFFTALQGLHQRRYGFFHASAVPSSAQHMDTATVVVHSQVQEPIQLLGQFDECEGCPMLPLATVAPFRQASVDVSTVYNVRFAVHDAAEELCSFGRDFQLKELGKYHINVSRSDERGTACVFSEVIKGRDPYVPIYIFLGVAIGFAILWNIGSWLVKFYRSNNRFLVISESEDLSSSNETLSLETSPRRRIRSLDAFRGMTILLMIFVNNGGGGYWFFSHSIWNGITLADCVFPWFLFIMGVAINISMRSAIKKATSKSTLFLHILRRTALLVLFGLMINSIGYKSIEELRIPSVLGRFAVGYFIVATCELIFMKRLQITPGEVRWLPLRDLTTFWPTWLISLIFPIIQLLITYLLKVPNCPTGYVGPGGLHENASHVNCTGGAAGFIDQVIFGNSHIYQFPTCVQMYQTTAFDPEGLLGSLNSVFLVFLGLQAGRILDLYSSHKDKLIRLSTWGVLLGVIAGVLCTFSKNGGFIPVNKNLWSLSFILTNACSGMLILAALYYLIDVRLLWSGTPFFYPSVNSIILYVGSEILDDHFPFSWKVPSEHGAQLFMALWTTSLWCCISILMYWKNIYISL